MFNKTVPKILLLIAVVVIGLFSLTGCGKGASKQSESAAAGSQAGSQTGQGATRHLRFPGSAMGGSFYVQSSAIANLINNKLKGVDATVEVTSGGHENLKMVEEGADLALVNAMAVYQALNGLPPYERKVQNIRAIAWAAPSDLHVFTLKKTGIRSMADLKGKVISPGTRGSGTEEITRATLDALGMTYQDFKRVDYLTFQETVNALKNGQIDVGFMATGFPSGQIQELATQAELVLIPITPDEQAKITAKYPYFNSRIIPAGTYKGVDKDVPVNSLPSLLITNKDLPEDLVYDITKLIAENMQVLQGSHAGFKDWKMDSSAGQLLPLHPGAAKYYREVGK